MITDNSNRLPVAGESRLGEPGLVEGTGAPGDVDVRLVSFGFRHGPPPGNADLVLDVAHRFHDPAIDPELRDLTARHPAVRTRVRATPGVLDLITVLNAAASVIAQQPYGRRQRRDVPALIAVGCTGGRHRAPTIVSDVADLLGEGGWRVRVSHRDIDKPVLPPETGPEPRQ